MGATRTLEPDVIDPHIKNIATNKQIISMTTTEILYTQWSRNITSFFSSKTGGFVLIKRGITEAANDIMTTGRTGIRARIKSVNSIAKYLYHRSITQGDQLIRSSRAFSGLSIKF